MNRFCATGLMGLFSFFTGNAGYAQGNIIPATITPYEISISYDKTTNLIFPYAIRSVDRGSGAVIVQKAKNVDNILQTKAAKKYFEPTNLSIVTADGKFYSFAMQYAEQPEQINFSFAGDQPMIFSDKATNMQQLEREAFEVLGMSRFMGLQYRQQALRLQLHGVFISENSLWLKFRLHNDSQVDFQPQYVRFFLRDRKRAKRTALNETEIFPIYMPHYAATRGNASSVLTVGLKPFTVPKHQRLIIQIGDKSGGRTLLLSVKGKFILRARKLPLN